MLKSSPIRFLRQSSGISRKRSPARILSVSAAETRACGKKLARHLRPGDVVFLCGSVGSGKTTFAQGVAAGLGLREYLRSSSFILVNEYCVRGTPLYHIDLYRLEGLSFDSFGLEEYLYGDGICLIEWADKIVHSSVKSYWNIDFQSAGDNAREITVAWLPRRKEKRSGKDNSI
ncbi:MAG: tRNA (adenosine(37)-N6)-threonylcarbamoyltransferase complex ATPase subunit type 1 TsaE [Elusimicrobia bacterium]|nr:tRNA (adenosine(37)-N6)-threonylcarbamoyltransferase complex ATPase subunit type 1 TsaE [Elusimicrobiota bacterium]